MYSLSVSVCLSLSADSPYFSLATATPQLTDVLQKVTVPVVDLLECHKRLPDEQGIATPKGILPTQLCAGAPGRDSCKVGHIHLL